MTFYHWLGREAEGYCPASEINNRLREIMATIRARVEADGWITLHPKLN